MWYVDVILIVSFALLALYGALMMRAINNNDAHDRE